MILENKLNITDQAELAREEERISKKRAKEMFETGYLDTLERSPIKDIEIKELLKQSLINKIDDRDVYMKGIDNSYLYEGYLLFKTDEL